MKITNPMQQQKDDAEKKTIEEHHAFLFILKPTNINMVS